MDYLGQHRETHGQRQSKIARHGDLLRSEAERTHVAPEHCGSPWQAEILVTANLMISDRAIYYTLVVQGIVLVGQP
jgi:hypothetical protein